MRDVVADAAQLVEQLHDLVEHQIDVARDAVDVVALGEHRQPLLDVALHDVGDRGVDVGKPTIGAPREDRRRWRG